MMLMLVVVMMGQRTLLQLECEQQKHILRVLETRENEIALLSQNLKGMYVNRLIVDIHILKGMPTV